VLAIWWICASHQSSRKDPQIPCTGVDDRLNSLFASY
jgi:hypothetical protein